MISGTHLICISIWKSESGPSLQSLNLMATIGYTLAPLLCKPFISSAGVDGHLETNTSVIPLQPMVNESLDSADSYYVRNMSISDPREDNSKIQYAYMIVAIYDLVIGILLMILFVKDGCKTKGSKTEDNPENSPSDEKENSRAFEIKICTSCSLCLIYFMVELK